MFFGFLFTFIFSVIHAAPLDLSETALLEEVIPQLDKRLSQAAAKRNLAEAYFVGNKPLKASFSHFSNSDLLDLSVIYAELHQLNIRAEKRAAEAADNKIYQTSNANLDAFKIKKQAVWNLESEVDDLHRRLLSRLAHQLKANPSISSTQLHQQRALLRRLRAETDVDPKEASTIAYIASLLDEERRLVQLEQALLDYFSRNRLVSLNEVVDNDIDKLGLVNSPVKTEHILFRLNFARSLMDSERQKRIDERVASSTRASFDLELKTLKSELSLLKQNPENFALTLEDKPGLLEENQILLNRLTETDGVENQTVQARIDLNEQRLALIENIVRKQQEDDIIASRQIQEDLIEAQQKLDLARKEADAAAEKEQSMQAILNDIVGLRRQLADLQTGEAQRRSDFQLKSNDISQRIRATHEDSKAAIGLPPLDPVKDKSIDKSFIDSHNLVLEIQSQILSMRRQKQALVSSGEKLIESLTTDEKEVPLNESEFDEQIKERNQSITDLIYAVDSQETNFQSELEALFPLLLEAKRTRRMIESHASMQSKLSIRDTFETELKNEALLFPLKIAAGFHAFQSALSDLPSKAMQLSQISGSFWLLVTLALFLYAWRFCREHAHKAMLSGLESLQRLLWMRLSIQPEKIQLEPKSFVEFSKRFVDIAALLFLSSHWAESAPILSLIVYVTSLLFVFRTAPILIQMLHPILSGFSQFDQKIQSDLYRSLQTLFCWWMGFEALKFASLALFDADRTADIFGWIQSIALIAIVFQLLKKWEQLITALALYHSEEGVLLRWLNTTSQGWFGIRLRAFIGLLILVQHLLGSLKSILIEGSSWIGSTIAKRSIHQRGDGSIKLSNTVRSLFENSEANGILFGDEEEAFTEAITEWNADKARGMVAIVGDYATGKSKILNRIAAPAECGLALKSFSLKTRFFDKETAHKWVCEQFQLPQNVTDSEVVDLINASSPTLFCIDNLHYAAFRDVGGYDALRYLIRLMQATSQKHFWVVTFHSHTWEFLEGAAAPVNLSVFRKTIHIKPLTYLEMSKWFKTRVSSIGFEMKFNRLAPEEASEKIIKRAETAYWRLLVDETLGNQSVAERFFIEAMSKGSKENEIEIGLFLSPSEEELFNLVDLERFVLMSILIHDGLSVELLCQCLNEKRDLVETACRHLVGLGICYWDSEELQVDLSWRPQVLRTLKKQRLLYAG